MKSWSALIRVLVVVGLFVSTGGAADSRLSRSDTLDVTTPRPTLVIPQFNGPATFGVDLAKAPWSTAARTTGLLTLNSRQLNDYPTHIYACYDRTALWLAYRCEGIDGRSAKIDARERDGRVWWDDGVEFYCSPDHSRLHFTQFAANAAGIAYDGKDSKGEWNAKWQVASVVDEKGFTIAMRIPFSQLKVRTPEPGSSWPVNFSRHGPISGHSAWVWSYNGLHDPRQFGQLVFGGPGLKPARVQSLSPWAMGENVIEVENTADLVCRITGLDSDGAKIFETNAAAKAERFTVSLIDDAVRTVEASLETADGKKLARWCSDMKTAELKPRLADWSRRFETMDRVASKIPAELADEAKKLVAAGKPRLAEAKQLAEKQSAYSLETWTRLQSILDELDRELGDLSSYARTLEHYPNAGFAVGFESPMRQVMIQDFAFNGWFDREARVSLAGNENEALQVVVMPFARDLKKVTVQASVSAPSASPAAAISCNVSLVGHVDVGDDPPYVTHYKEFYPDPLLSFLQSADIKAGEDVAFWLDVATGKETPAGEYRGSIKVTAEGCSPVTIPLVVKVWDFKLPDGTHLRNAFTYHENMIGRIHGKRWGNEMARAYQDLILDHRLGIDHLYRKEPPDIDTLKRAVAKGMNAFNIAFAGSGGVKKHLSEALNNYVPKIREAGLLDLAYVYGFDEIKADKFADARDVFETVHRLAPGIPTMTTAADHTFGKESGLRDAVDIWVPLTPSYDLVEAEELRREGKQMWWYVCLVPVQPYANWFVESPVIESRLLMGAMSHKYRVDGFLYYLVNNGWERNKEVISSGPRTQWDPASCENSKGKWANGDGNLIYPGPEGPLSSLRLENIRDGLEDYEYLYLLKQRAEQVKKLPASATRAKFIEEADALLAVPDTVVRSVVEYTYRPESLAKWRARMAELIVQGASLAAQN